MHYVETVQILTVKKKAKTNLKKPHILDYWENLNTAWLLEKSK